MNLGIFSIKKMLLITAFVVLTILVTIGLSTNFYIGKSFNEFELLMKIERVLRLELELRNAEKDFLLRETFNPEFFENGKSQITQKFDSLSNDVATLLNQLTKSENVGENYKVEAEKANKAFQTYNTYFKKTSNLIREKGFKDYGIEGKFRQSIHTVEALLNEGTDYRLKTYMLTLRRHEKDYLLRKELRYKERFWQVLETFISEVRKQGYSSKNEQLVASLGDYGRLFNTLIEKDIEIGLSDNDGLLGHLKTSSNDFERQVQFIHESVFSDSRRSINSSIYALFIVLVIFSAIAVGLIVWVSDHIVGSIRKLRTYILRLGKGELPSNIDIEGNNEISQMADSVNVLVENLRSTREFAIQVGNGNLETEVNVFGNQGDLGGALIEMRKKLLQVSKEREQQAAETQCRLWTNEGMARFAEILRHKGGTIEDLAFETLKNLIKFTGCCIGGFFLSTDEGELELISAYAYDRRKYTKRKIAKNEGLVGMCFLEGEITYMTEIPKDYFFVSSGMGEAPPVSLVLIPLKADDEVMGVIEMASLKELSQFELDFIAKVAASIATTLKMVKVQVSTRILLDKTKMQAEILAEHEEELRQNMEELQSTQEQILLRERQLHEEIEQKNSQLVQTKINFAQELKLKTKRISDFEVMFNALENSHIVIEIAPDGQILKANRNYYDQIMVESTEEPITIFSGSLPGQEGINRKDWIRIVKGESYKGLIHRIDKLGKHVAIQATFTPCFDEFEENIVKVLCIGQVIGSVGLVETTSAKGSWCKEFVGNRKLASELEIN